MPGNFRNDDLRVTKTYNALLEALPKLLKRRSFARITVNDLCEEAQLSRAAFYSHFQDKYNLLVYWLSTVKAEIVKDDLEFPYVAESINNYIKNNTKLVTNLFSDATNETMELFHKFILSCLEIPKTYEGVFDPKNIVLSNFCAGGIVNFIRWQINNHFPLELQTVNTYITKFVSTLLST